MGESAMPTRARPPRSASLAISTNKGTSYGNVTTPSRCSRSSIRPPPKTRQGQVRRDLFEHDLDWLTYDDLLRRDVDQVAHHPYLRKIVESYRYDVERHPVGNISDRMR